MKLVIKLKVKNSKKITSNKHMRQTLITDYFEKILCIKSVKTVSYSTYRRYRTGLFKNNNS